jgi:hypothetical protein
MIYDLSNKSVIGLPMALIISCIVCFLSIGLVYNIRVVYREQ